MKHCPDYVYLNSGVIPRPAAPPVDERAQAAADRVALANPISRWAASWRSLVYLGGVLAALALLIGMFAYGVIAIGRAAERPTSPTWVRVTPMTYGPPVGTPR